MTKREMFGFIATEMAENAEVVEFCNHEIELLDARKTSKGMSKTQKANLEVIENIKSALAEIGTGVTVTDLIAMSPVLHGLTNQKVSALLRKLIEEKVVVKTIEGKKALFALA